MSIKYLKIVIIVISIVGVVGISIMKLTGIWGFIFSKDFVNEKISYKIIDNPKKTAQISLLLHVKDASHDAFTNIYIIPDGYTEGGIPKEKNYLMFPDSTGISWEWIDNNNLRLYCSKKPEINSFNSEKIKIELVIGRQKIDELEAEGKQVIWYEITK